MEEPIHKKKLEEGIVVEVHHDDDPFSPREDDNLGTMVCWHRRYDLGDRQIKDGEFDSPADIMAAIVADEGPLQIALPLYLYDHSGITMRTSGFGDVDAAGWDWGQVGFIYISEKKVIAEYGSLNKESHDQAMACLQGEVETYDQYLTSAVYGYIIKGPDGDHLDSCWGFYGDSDDCLAEAVAAARTYVADEKGPQPVLGVEMP